MAVIYIPTYFRLVRGQTLTIKEELYVEAARAIESEVKALGPARHLLKGMAEVA